MTLDEQALALAPSLRSGSPFVYIIELRSGAFYVGSSTDYEARFRDHQIGAACRTTLLDPPIAVRFIKAHTDITASRRREAQIKKWSRAKKAALIAGDLARLKILSRSHENGLKPTVAAAI